MLFSGKLCITFCNCFRFLPKRLRQLSSSFSALFPVSVVLGNRIAFSFLTLRTINCFEYFFAWHSNFELLEIYSNDADYSNFLSQ